MSSRQQNLNASAVPKNDDEREKFNKKKRILNKTETEKARNLTLPFLVKGEIVENRVCRIFLLINTFSEFLPFDD